MSKQYNVETECKFLDINRKQMERKLRRAGAERTFEGLVVDKFYDTVNQELRKGGEVLRVRTRIPTRGVRLGCTVTYKGKMGGTDTYKRRREEEFCVDNSTSLEFLLNRVHIQPVSHREKRRVSYHFEKLDVTADIDKYPRLPWMMELEGTETAIRKAAKKLGLSLDDAYGKNWQEQFPGYNFYNCRFRASIK